MLTRRSFPVFLGLSAAIVLAALGSRLAAGQRPAYPIVQEIHVDQKCRILPAPAQPVTPDTNSGASQKKTRPIKDPVVCHLESIHGSEHREEAIVGNELLRNRVEVEEQEFVLQNISADPVVFVVEQPVIQGWQVDSDPQPTAIVGTTALFRVNAAPGEIVHLHVGERHTTPLKAKAIRTTTPAGSARG